MSGEPERIKCPRCGSTYHVDEEKVTCGARLMRPGEFCRRPPMKGRTRCYRHGGKTPMGPDNPAYSHGRNSKLMPQGLANAEERVRAETEEIIDQTDNMIRLKAMTLEYLESIADKDNLSSRDRQELMTIIEQERKVAQTWHKIITTDTIPRAVIVTLLTAFMYEIHETLSEAGDAEKRTRLLRFLEVRLFGSGTPILSSTPVGTDTALALDR